MSLGERLVDALRPGASGEVEAEGGGVRATADVEGSGPYGADLRSLTVERTDPLGETRREERLQETLEAIEKRVDYLPERIGPLETDGPSGRAVLRSRRDQVQGREYYEVRVEGGDRIDVQRFRGRAEQGGRDVLAENYGHGVLRRLVDDLGDILSD